MTCTCTLHLQKHGLSLLLQTPHAAQSVTACDLKGNITAPEVCGAAAPPTVGPKPELPEE